MSTEYERIIQRMRESAERRFVRHQRLMLALDFAATLLVTAAIVVLAVLLGSL